MTVMLAIGFPVLLVFGGALLAFAFSAGRPEPAAARPPVEVPEPLGQRSLVFFQPVGWSSEMKAAPIEEIVAALETHLRRERSAHVPPLRHELLD